MTKGRGPDGRFLEDNDISVGNKGGRPSGDKEMLARFKAAVTPEDLDAITEVLVTQARDGNRAAMKLLFNYLFGLPRQAIEIEADVRTNVQYLEALERVTSTVDQSGEKGRVS